MNILQIEELFGFRYNFIYYITAVIVFLCIVEFYFKNKSTEKIQNILLSILLVIIVILFGFRTEYVGHDTPNNIKYFVGKANIYSISDVKDIGLYFSSLAASSFTKNTDFFLVILALLYVGPIYIGIRNLKLNNPLIFFFFIFSFFFFRSMGINTQRQGIAFAFFFCAIIYYFNNRKAMTYAMFVIAFLFHASIILPITVFLFSNKLKDIRLPLAVYVFSTILSLLNFKIYDFLVNVPIVTILVEERLESYTNVEVSNYRVGFRPDFWIFNTVFLIIGLVTYKNMLKLKLNAVLYRSILISYILLSSFFFLMFSARFSDRFGFLAWMFIPFLLMPYVSNQKSVGVFNTVTVFFICLTLATIFNIL